MTDAERLAEEYADAVATHRLESLYGTSKSYTLEKAKERDEAHEALTTELRRLSTELAAQGVPDGWRELMSEALDNALASTVEEGISHDRRNYRRELAQRIKQALNASAPPAPQAAVVQQEPKFWAPPERDGAYHAHDAETVYRTPKAGWYPLYTHPAQQAKPQPLSDERDARIAELERQLAEAHAVLKETGLLLHHFWCDVQMNDYSFLKLNKGMEAIDNAMKEQT